MRIAFALILLVLNQVSGDPPECYAPEADDVEILLETLAGFGPVSEKTDMLYFTPTRNSSSPFSLLAPRNRDNITWLPKCSVRP